MIQPQSYLNIADNTGAKTIMCIRVLGNQKRVAKIGDVIIGVVKKALPNMSVKKADIVHALIIRTKRFIKRKDGTVIKFDDNAAVLINKDNNPRGTRIFGPIAKEVRSQKYIKIISLADQII